MPSFQHPVQNVISNFHSQLFSNELVARALQGGARVVRPQDLVVPVERFEPQVVLRPAVRPVQLLVDGLQAQGAPVLPQLLVQHVDQVPAEEPRGAPLLDPAGHDRVEDVHVGVHAHELQLLLQHLHPLPRLLRVHRRLPQARSAAAGAAGAWHTEVQLVVLLHSQSLLPQCSVRLLRCHQLLLNARLGPLLQLLVRLPLRRLAPPLLLVRIRQRLLQQIVQLALLGGDLLGQQAVQVVPQLGEQHGLGEPLPGRVQHHAVQVRVRVRLHLVDLLQDLARPAVHVRLEGLPFLIVINHGPAFACKVFFFLQASFPVSVFFIFTVVLFQEVLHLFFIVTL
mmetsp:Transcript_10635/g.16772  ORF Transcript_10635/g.16772 Transcript_10635/m.16772 type:complete len:339 (-) Transcript_10635:715-1731(-)